MNLEAMSIDELDTVSADLKAKINALRDERRAVKFVREEKVVRRALEEKLSRPGQPVSTDGIPYETVLNLYGISREGAPSGVVVSPATGSLSASPSELEASNG